MSTAKRLSFSFPGFSIEADPNFVACAFLDAARQASGASLQQAFVRDAHTPVIGEVWPGQGGIYLGPIKDEDGLTYHLVRATTDLKDNAAWGTSGEKLSGCDNKWHGLRNTQAMAEAGSEVAKTALELEIDGHQDFYIPALREAMLQYINAPKASKPELYWTSTQYDSYNAWCQSFDVGDSDIRSKDNTLRVCAVRRFLAN
ncbi:MAG: DUF1566 domain-containing protein [Pseudomonadota bacterium]